MTTTQLKLPKTIVLSQEATRWCAEGGHPDLGRYLAMYFETKLPTP